MNQPTSAEIKKYIDIVDELSRYETSMYIIRGRGAFERDKNFPDPVIEKVRDWLLSLTIT